jgi:hypothetical protein
MGTTPGSAGSTGAQDPVPNLPPDPLSYEEQVYAIKTWRYLRMAMVVLVVGLGVSIGYERWKVNPGCFQTSISGYYYTPVHGYFVGALVSIGVCLFCLKGSTEAEDILLNLAGMFAPIVALVPTPDTGTCASVLGTTQDRDVNVANNVTALLAVGFLALLIIAALAAQNLPPLPVVLGYAVAATVWIAAALVFWLGRHFFVRNAHYTAAVLMFVCILLVVAINAFGYKEKTKATSARNRYGVIAGAMGASSVIIIIAGLLGWDYWIILIEATLISLFAVFWVIQTKELWHEGLR